MARLLVIDCVLREAHNLLERENEFFNRDAEGKLLLHGAFAGDDSDDVTERVEHRAAGIARVDGDPELIISLAFQRCLRAHDPAADRVLEDQLAPGAGIADRSDVFPLAEGVGLGDAQWRERRLYLEEGQVAASVFKEKLGGHRALVVLLGGWETHSERRDEFAINHMGIGRENAGPDEETRPD